MPAGAMEASGCTLYLRRNGSAQRRRWLRRLSAAAVEARPPLAKPRGIDPARSGCKCRAASARAAPYEQLGPAAEPGRLGDTVAAALFDAHCRRASLPAVLDTRHSSDGVATVPAAALGWAPRLGRQWDSAAVAATAAAELHRGAIRHAGKCIRGKRLRFLPLPQRLGAAAPSAAWSLGGVCGGTPAKPCGIDPTRSGCKCRAASARVAPYELRGSA